MKKKYVVCVDNSSKYLEENFIDYLNENKLGWWHWIDNVWLLTDSKGVLSASKIRNSINEIFEKSNCIVIELRGNNDTWAGFGPAGEKKNMFKWIENNWGK